MKKILVNLEKCYKCKKCVAQCSYYFHPDNNGIERLLSKAAQQLVCRKCEEAFCIASCPKEALEKDENGILHRHLFRCISCKSCSIACPFGTIYPELLNYKSSMCDYCVDRLKENEVPLCVKTCTEGALEFVEIKETEEKQKELQIYPVDGNLSVRTFPWTAWRK